MIAPYSQYCYFMISILTITGIQHLPELLHSQLWLRQQLYTWARKCQPHSASVMGLPIAELKTCTKSSTVVFGWQQVYLCSLRQPSCICYRSNQLACFLVENCNNLSHLLLLPLLYILSGLTGRIIILIQASHSEELVVLHTYLRLAKVRRSVSCYMRLSMLVWFSLLASHTLPAKITSPSGTTFITKPANLDS